jgi:hypothetical protein
MLAVLKITAPLAKPGMNFRLWKQVRTGLLSYPVDADSARGHLASSVYLQMAVQPDILHVVSFTEADHAATAQDVISSAKMARRAIENALGGPDLTQDEGLQSRVDELVEEAAVTIDAIQNLGSGGGADPLADAATLALAVKTGILDAPQLKNNPYGRGQIATQIDSRGACVTVERITGQELSEAERLKNMRL